MATLLVPAQGPPEMPCPTGIPEHAAGRSAGSLGPWSSGASSILLSQLMLSVFGHIVLGLAVTFVLRCVMACMVNHSFLRANSMALPI